jgi:hypothetical protein
MMHVVALIVLFQYAGRIIAVEEKGLIPRVTCQTNYFATTTHECRARENQLSPYEYNTAFITAPRKDNRAADNT